MFENLYTTKMSMDKKKLQNRFTKIRSRSGRISKLMALIMTIVMALTFVCATVVMAVFDGEENKEPIALYSGGKEVVLENKPFIKDNMTYFPIREIFEKLGVFEIEGNELIWDNGTIHIKVRENEDKELTLYTIKIDSDEIVIKHSKDQRLTNIVAVQPTMNMSLHMPGVTPLLIGDKTYVPYTFIDYMLNRGLGIRNEISVFDFMFTINIDSPSAFLSQGYTWPADGDISNPYGERIHPVTGEVKKHNGIDIAAPEGSDVMSAIYGTVTETGYDTEKGYYVIIERNNIKTVYTSLMQDIRVKKGDEVIRGQIIGKVGQTGTSTGAHLHFEVLINGEYYDPQLIS